MPWWPNTGCAQSGQIPLHAALALFNSVSTPTAVISSVYHLRWWAGGLTLRSATSAVFYPKSVTQRRKQVALCALQPAGRRALAFTPRAQLVLTSIQVLKCVCPCAGGNTDFVAVTLPEGSRASALAGGSSGSSRSSWVCVCLCPLCTESPPASPARGALGICTPGENQQGCTCPVLFRWTRRPEITRCARGSLREQGASSPWFQSGVIYLSWWKPPPRPWHLQLVLVSSQSCVCGSNIKVFPPLPEKSIGLIHSPTPALSLPGLLAVWWVDSGARSVAAAAEIGAIRRSRKGAAARGSQVPG